MRDLTRQRVKLSIETALNAELGNQPGYAKHGPTWLGSGNSGNGGSRKRLKGQHGEVVIDAPRELFFVPQFARKDQPRVTHMDDRILALHANSVSARDIIGALKQMCGADASGTLTYKVTACVTDQIVEWQSRPMDAFCPSATLRCTVLTGAQTAGAGARCIADRRNG